MLCGNNGCAHKTCFTRHNDCTMPGKLAVVYLCVMGVNVVCLLLRFVYWIVDGTVPTARYFFIIIIQYDNGNYLKVFQFAMATMKLSAGPISI